MKFEGFSAHTRFTSVPDLFINQLAPQMSAAETVLMLAVFNILFNKKGYPRYTLVADLATHPALYGQDVATIIQAVVKRGLLLPLTAGEEVFYFLNNPEGREAVARAERGELKLLGANAVKPAPTIPAYPNIFTLYEENIGLLTPMIAEELRDALNTYPEEWLREALREAVSLNKRSWRYIQRILEHWVAEGKKNYGTHRTDPERDKFVRGRYGGLVQR
ncbi:MAG: DnaD domain protein [Dehalococcoidia bacterium]|nr:DnaD domain protein [Dehalococcoidia bacterium]